MIEISGLSTGNNLGYPFIKTNFRPKDDVV